MPLELKPSIFEKVTLTGHLPFVFYPRKLHSGLIESCPVLCFWQESSHKINERPVLSATMFFLGLIFPFIETYSEEEINWGKQGAELWRKPNGKKRGARL